MKDSHKKIYNASVDSVQLCGHKVKDVSDVIALTTASLGLLQVELLDGILTELRRLNESTKHR